MGNVDVEHGGAADSNSFIQDTVKSIFDCVEKQNHTKQAHSSIIKRVHTPLRNLSPRSFKPQVVSIGPLHRSNINVQAFNRQKATSLSSLLSHFEKTVLTGRNIERMCEEGE